MPLPLGQKLHLAFQTYDIPSQVLADDPIVVEILKESTLPLGFITAKWANKILKRCYKTKIMLYIDIAIPKNPDFPGKYA